MSAKCKAKQVTWKAGQSGNPTGKKPGTRSRRSVEAIEAAAAANFDPLAFLIEVAKSDPDMDRRIDAAKACMPYLHPRLNATDLRTSGAAELTVRWVDATAEQDAPTLADVDTISTTRDDGPG